MRVLVFGDSIGHGLWDERGGWVQRLRSELDANFMQDFGGLYLDIYNLSISGDTSAGIVSRIEREIRARCWPGTPFAIIVAVGTNDAGVSRVHTELEQYRENLQNIVESARSFSDNLLFAGLPPVDEKLTRPWFADETVSFANDDLQVYERAAQEICAAQNIPFVPIFERFQAEQLKQNLLSDGLHPNAVGHELIASLVRPELDNLLEV